MKQLAWIAMLLLLSWGCSEGEGDVNPLPKGEDDGIQAVMYGVKFLFSDSLRVQARMEALQLTEKMEKKDPEKEDSEKEKVLYLEKKVDLYFYDSRMNPHSEIHANDGVYYEEKGLAELRGDVRLTNRRGEKLNTELLFWNKKKEQIYTDQFVRVESAGKIIKGDSGLVSNTSFTDYEVKGVSGILPIEENEEIDK